MNLIVCYAYSFVDFGHSPFDGAKVLLFADIRKVLFSPFCLYASPVCKKKEIICIERTIQKALFVKKTTF